MLQSRHAHRLCRRRRRRIRSAATKEHLPTGRTLRKEQTQRKRGRERGGRRSSPPHRCTHHSSELRSARKPMPPALEYPRACRRVDTQPLPAVCATGKIRARRARRVRSRRFALHDHEGRATRDEWRSRFLSDRSRRDYRPPDSNAPDRRLLRPVRIPDGLQVTAPGDDVSGRRASAAGAGSPTSRSARPTTSSWSATPSRVSRSTVT
jgi:hypothetical protein